MGKKFDKIYESVIHRYQAGGFLTGDVVNFKKGYKSSDFYKTMHPEMQQQLEDLINSELNLVVTQVGYDSPGDSSGNQFKTSEDAVITVAGDHGGGRTYGQITVPAEILELDSESDGINLPKIPQKFRRESPGYEKGEKYKRDPKFITNVSDKATGKGNDKVKNTPTNLKLAGESTRMSKEVGNMVSLYESMYNENRS